MRRHLPLPVSLALALLLLVPVRPAAAANAVLQGKVTSTFIFTITYTPDGKAAPNQTRDDQYTKAYTNSILLLTDDKRGGLGQVDAQNNVSLVAPTLIAIPADDKNNSYILDGLSKDAKTLVSFHVYLVKRSDDPQKATALGHVVELLADGTVNSTDITLELQLG